MIATTFTSSASHGRAVAGFSLIELAIAIFVITLLLGGILVPLATQVEQRKVSETQKALDEIREALLGFALVNGYLPCPDKTTSAGVGGTPNDGQEDVNLGTCVATGNEGNLPWVTLGTGGADIWGNRFRYRVHGSFAQRAPASLFTMTTTSNLQVCTTDACTSFLTSGADGPPAIIVSHGKNGLGARNSITNAANPAPVSADELENTDGGTSFVSHAQSAAGSGAGEFDDIVTWISRNVLLNRMVTAGKLP